MSDFVSWVWWGIQGLWGHLKEISILLGGIGSLGGYYFSHWKSELADPASLEKLRPYLDDSSWRDTYRRTLEDALDAADRFFGPPVSSRSYGVCLTVAFVYPVIFYVFNWITIGPNSIGGISILPKDWSVWEKLFLLGEMILYGYTVLYTSLNESELNFYFKKNLCICILYRCG